jgi:hypothetical protein
MYTLHYDMKLGCKKLKFYHFQANFKKNVWPTKSGFLTVFHKICRIFLKNYFLDIFLIFIVENDTCFNQKYAKNIRKMCFYSVLGGKSDNSANPEKIPLFSKKSKIFQNFL